MPLIEFKQDPLMIELPDLVVGNITIKRKAQIIEQTYNPVEKKVSLTFDVFPFADNKGDFGDRLDIGDDSFFKTVRNTIVAANKFLVDSSTGKVLTGIDSEYMYVKEEKVLDPILEGKNYMPDFDFYDYVAHTQQIILVQMIAQAIVSNMTT